tara:strand:+ start:562 stop:1629 length:1068 start_codon:yes stop_codon:yes gene_type:complete
MIDFIANWCRSRFSDPHALTLFFSLLGLSFILYLSGTLIAPLLTALALAFLLDCPVTLMCRYGAPRSLSATLVLVLTMTLIGMFIFKLLPNIWHQSLLLIGDFPSMIDSIQVYLKEFSYQHPSLLPTGQLNSVISELHTLVDPRQLIQMIKSLMGWSMNALVLCVYIVLVPLLVFFFLKDKTELKYTSARFFPQHRKLLDQVWVEMNQQLLNYVRGKIIEIIILGIVTYTFFSIMGLRYAALLAVLNGISVLIPYIGAVLVTVPIALVAFFQWQWSPEFGYLMMGYTIIQILDGNVLVPLLFAEVVELHPVVIIAAILVFGGVGGILGVFFAIPLASLLKTIVNVWPKAQYSLPT